MAQQRQSRRQPPQNPPNQGMVRQFLDSLSLSARLLLDGRVGCLSKLIPLMMVGYILSPFDFIPDVLLPFGVVDDLGVLLAGLQLFIRSAPRQVVDYYRAQMYGFRGAPPPDEVAGQQPGDPRRADPRFQDPRYQQQRPPRVVDGEYRVSDDEHPRSEYNDQAQRRGPRRR